MANEAEFAVQKLSSGFVYFARAGRQPIVKIGWATNPQRRLDQLQTGSPHKLHLLGYTPGIPSDETDWQYTWRPLRVRGEWFNLTNDLRDAINHRLFQPDATCFVHIKTDWRAIRKAAA